MKKDDVALHSIHSVCGEIIPKDLGHCQIHEHIFVRLHLHPTEIMLLKSAILIVHALS